MTTNDDRPWGRMETDIPAPPVVDMCRTPVGGVERRCHPGENWRSYTRAEFMAFARAQHPGGAPAVDVRGTAVRMWGESHSALDTWVPLPVVQALRLPGAVVLCTAPRYLSLPIKSGLRDLGIQVSAGAPGDATTGLGPIEDWFQRWATKTITVASTCAEISGSELVTLLYLRGPPHSSSQREWCARGEIAHRIAAETNGRVSEVRTAILDPVDLCSFLGLSHDELRRAWG